MTSAQETQQFLATGEYDMAYKAWQGHNTFERIQAGEAALRAALADALRQRTKVIKFPSMPPDFDAGQFVLGKVRPMVCGLFPERERQALLDLFENSLVFVTHDNIDSLIQDTDRLSTAHQIANLFLGSLGLPGLDDQPVEFVGFSEETTFYVSMAYFKDSDPFADWVIHEAAHVFHNWKRASVGLPHTQSREFLLNIAFAKREVFAYACEAYSRILERAKDPTDRRRLYAEYVKNGVHADVRISRDELVDVVASAVAARNGWNRILANCSPPGMIGR